MSCWQKLSKGQVPKKSLVAFDEGSLPPSPSPAVGETTLPYLTLIESLIVAPLRPFR